MAASWPGVSRSCTGAVRSGDDVARSREDVDGGVSGAAEGQVADVDAGATERCSAAPRLASTNPPVYRHCYVYKHVYGHVGGHEASTKRSCSSTAITMSVITM